MRATVGIRTKRWKLITYDGDDIEELYDLENDPGELRNLAKDASSTVLIAELRSQLADLRRLALAGEIGP